MISIDIIKKLACAAAIAAISLSASSAMASYEIANVVKISGIPWFNRMEAGVKEAGKELGVNAYQVGASTADPAAQVRVIEDLIAKGVDAITIVPNDAQVLEPVILRAKERGIVVLTHEAPDQKGADWNIETIDADKYAKANMDMLAQSMGEKGGYVIYVGSLTVPLHNYWADTAVKYQKEKYPDMYEVTARMPVAESIEQSYSTTLELMTAHKDLGGIIGFGSLGPIGAGQAIRARRASEKVAVVGIAMPSQAYPYLRKGEIKRAFLWDPKDAGAALVAVAKKILDGEKVEDGMAISGLGQASVDSDSRNIRFNRILEVSAENARQLGF